MVMMMTNLGTFASVVIDQPLAERADYLPSASLTVNKGVRLLNETWLTPQLQVNTRFDARQLTIGVDSAQRIHVPRKIENNGHVGALAGQAGARATRQHGGSRCPASGQGGFHVRGVTGQDNPDRKLPVV